MEKIKCKKCEKVIEGYSLNHVNYLMMQHDLTHQRKEQLNKQEEVQDGI